MSHHKYKLALLKRLRELGGRLEDIGAALAEEHSKDWEDMAIETEGEEVLEALCESGQAEIARIRSFSPGERLKPDGPMAYQHGHGKTVLSLLHHECGQIHCAASGGA